MVMPVIYFEFHMLPNFYNYKYKVLQNMTCIIFVGKPKCKGNMPASLFHSGQNSN